MSWRDSRRIIERIIVEGDLVLLTPTSLGNGDSDGLTDMSLLLDEIEGKALLTGTSIAGALRNYLRECEKGFEVKENDTSVTRQLFGYHEDNYKQSYLIIDDALSSEKPATELRDGVRIEGKTRTAADKAKFDLELLEGGTKFKLRFELLICEDQDRNKLVSALATALQGLEKGEIHIGARKRRGYGECKVESWKVQLFDLTSKAGLLEWLNHDTSCFNVPAQSSILTALNSTKIKDARTFFELKAWFALDGSILIRSGSKLPNVSDKGQPDTVHLRSNGKPIVSGTSLAGALRHRAFKIVNTLNIETRIVEQMFGDDDQTKKDKRASRLEVKEIEITNTSDLVQTRVKIDRFTGGAFEGALFDAAPVFAQTDDKAVEISLKLRTPKEAEIGLLLLLLKDLWTSDLAIGGESSIGRGRLKGKKAELKFNETDKIILEAEDDNKIKPLDNDEMKRLNNFVDVFNQEIKTEQINEQN